MKRVIAFHDKYWIPAVIVGTVFGAAKMLVQDPLANNEKCFIENMDDMLERASVGSLFWGCVGATFPIGIPAALGIMYLNQQAIKRLMTKIEKRGFSKD